MAENHTGKRILILDDEPDIITYFEILLNDHGYRTLSAQDGVDGLAKARAEHPDLITLDISMPKKSGVRLYCELKNDPDLKTIPVVGYVPKPVDRDEFLAVIDRTLAGTPKCPQS